MAIARDREGEGGFPWEGMRLVLDMGGTFIRSGYVDDHGALDLSGCHAEKIARGISTRRDLCDLVAQRIETLGGQQANFVLSIAGPVSADNRIVRKYTNVLPDDTDIPVADMVENAVKRRTGREVRVYVIKDAVASTIAEMGPGGAAADRDEVIALILGTGTGGAPCKRLATGEIVFPDALADLGHHQVDMNSTEPCNCGGTGCVEQQTSGTAIVASLNGRARDARFAEAYHVSRLFRERGILPGAITGVDVSWAAASGDPFAIDALREAAKPLSLLLRNVFTSHPGMTVVFVGGFALGTGYVLIDLVRGALRVSGIPFVRRGEVERFVETRVLLGTIPADRTNLVGARLFLLQEERRGDECRRSEADTGGVRDVLKRC
jgi:predicted NBD/HSP70 family sugar kinase